MPLSLLVVLVLWLISMHACVFVCPCMYFLFESFVCCVTYELDLVSCLLFGGHLKIFKFIICEPSFGISGYFLDLRLLCMISYGWLSLAAPIFFKKLFLMRIVSTHPLDLGYIPWFRPPLLKLNLL